jgi:hypothetical protein
MRYRVTRQASEKATTVPEVERGLSRRSTDRNTPVKSPPFRDIGVGISRISQEAGALAIDVNWQLLRPDDGKIYPRRVELQIHQSLRRSPVALRWLLS